MDNTLRWRIYAGKFEAADYAFEVAHNAYYYLPLYIKSGCLIRYNSAILHKESLLVGRNRIEKGSDYI